MFPDFGSNKIRVGVQIKTRAYVPPGTSTVGSTVTVVETGTGVSGGTSTSTCTTVEPANPVTGASYCPRDYVAAAEDSVTLTQTTVNPNLVLDPASQTLPPCEVLDPFGFCFRDVVFTDAGLPPAAVNDTATTLIGRPVDVDVLANDETHGAPATISAVTQPAHGQVTVLPAAPAAPAAPGGQQAAAAAAAATVQTVRYTPNAGYVGADPFTYTLSTANGTSTATVAVTVDAPPPTAKDDTAATTSGHAVTVDVTANDSANGGPPLRLRSVGVSAHGATRIEGQTVVYTPARDFAGTDRFRYTVATAYGTASAEVTVTVTAPAPPTSSSAAANPTATPSTNAVAPNTVATASTGIPAEQLLDIALGLVLGGGAATALGRRRRPNPRHGG